MAKLINWLDFQPSQAEIDKVCENFSETVTLREFRLKLIETILHGFPWDGRLDLVEAYHPANSFAQGAWIALPVHDKNKVRPVVWQVAKVVKTETTENPIQGKFDVLTLDLYGQQFQLVCGIPDAPFPVVDLSQYSTQEMAWLAEWIDDVYNTALQSALIREEKLCEKLCGETYLSEQKTNLTTPNDGDVDLASWPVRLLAWHQGVWKIIMKFLERFFRRKS